MTQLRSIVLLVAVLACVCLGSPARSSAGSASDVVAGFQADLVAAMKKAEALSVKQRYDLLKPSVERTFHVPLMTQIAAGRFWNEATPEERMRLIKAFRRMSVSTLATLFDSYSGEVFKVLGEKPGPQKTQVVLTTLIKADKSKVDIAYVARRFKDGWRLIDVIVDSGISELKVRRSEYNLVLTNEGVPGLIRLLDNKADELVSQ